MATPMPRSVPMILLTSSPCPWHSVKFEPVIDEFVAEFLGDLPLQLFDLVVLEFDDAARLDIDQVIVMSFLRFLIARSAVAKVMPFQNARLLEQSNRAIDRRDRDMRIDGDSPPM
jgi:hypothetical protein